MKILDPIHKYITFSDYESRLIRSILFQRLRYIRQLGFAEFAFPGAVHSRFLHSLGVCHLAGRAFDSLLFLKDFLPPKKRKEFRILIRTSALLHDIGHGPLSHISEIAMPNVSELRLPFLSNQKHTATHEHYTIKIILDSEITNIITDMGIAPQYVAHLINHKVPLPDNQFFIVKGVDFKPLLTQIISSNLDVDRMDYLQRDSFFCGTEYGFCDHEWILNNLRIYIENNRAFMGIGQKTVYSVENFFLGRRHMGLAVYFHSILVIMNLMLSRYLMSDDCDFHIPASLDQYTHCIDAALFKNLHLHAKNNEWARRITQNQVYEIIYEVQYMDYNKEQQLQKLDQAKQWLKEQNILFIEINSLDHIHQWHFVHNPDYPLYIVDELTNMTVDLRSRLEAFNLPLSIVRLYISPENKHKVGKNMGKQLF